MKLSKSEIRREIEKISSSYESEELFSSPYYFEILQAIVTSACESLKRIPRVEAICDGQSDFTACTEGMTVEINTLSPLIRERDTNWEKYVNCVGHMIHECGHVLFTDFVELSKMFEKWQKEKISFYPREPAVEDVDTKTVISYLDGHPNYKKLLLYEMKNIENIMEDVYIENCLFEKFDGVATLGLARSRQELYRQAPREDEIYNRVLDGSISPLIGFSQILLTLRTGYPLKEAECLNTMQKKVKELIESYLEKCEEEIDVLKWEPNGKKRAEMLNRILLKVKPLLPEAPDDEDLFDPEKTIEDLLNGSDSRQNGQQSSGSDYSDQDVNKQTGLSKQLADKAGMSAMPDGNSRPVSLEEVDRDEAEQSADQAKQNAESGSSCQHKFEQAIRKAAEKEFEKQDEQRHVTELQQEAEEICGNASQRGSVSFTGSISIDRRKVRADTIEDYRRIYDEISDTSRHLAKKLSNLLDDRETESADSGYLMGQRFNARDVVHNDGKYFSRISVPDGKLRVCFGILVDESGSMSGQKIISARKVSILLEDTLRRLDVPFCIYGHTTGAEDEVIIGCYADFDTNDGKDRYRLSLIEARNCNVDGAAITYVGEKLLKRPEEKKVLIVMSDGLPCSGSYYSDDADEDTALAVKYYRRKGINIFGAVVDEWEKVSAIYGEQFAFDCREEKELERHLIRLVRKYVRNQ